MDGRKYSLSVDEVLGQYRVVKPLGKGGMGEVYLVEHQILRTHHALKLLPSERAQSAGFLDRFRDEARVMANLKHRGIAHVTHADVSNGHHYLIMDFVSSGVDSEPFDLEEALAAAPEGRLPPDVVARLAIGICEAVGYAHGQGVIHRDLKPSNVLLTSRELNEAEPRVVDFGLARLVGEDWLRSVIDVSIRQSMSLGGMPTMAQARSERSTTGARLGTYEYMSPEQREGSEVDHRSDIYALGVMLYRMLTGKRLMGRAKAASRIVKGLDSDWDDLIDGCLEEDPAHRPQGMGTVRDALQTLPGEFGEQHESVRRGAEITRQVERPAGIAAIGVACRHCGGPLQEGDAFCITCGKPIAGVFPREGVADVALPTNEDVKHAGVLLRCKSCGGQLARHDRYCVSCGAEVEK